jgi:hypothetical protein
MFPLLAICPPAGKVYLAVAYCALALMLFPWLDSFDILRRIRLTIKVITAMIWLVLGFGAFMVAMLYFFSWADHHVVFQPILLGGILILVGGAGLAFVVATLRVYIKDFLALRDVTGAKSKTKSAIAQDFKRFKTLMYRLKYVEWLRHNELKPVGEWPNSRPNNRDDPASSMLAELDEGWLGLDS